MSKDVLRNDDQLDDLIITEDSHLKLLLEDSEEEIFIKIMPSFALELVIIAQNINNNIHIEMGENSILRYREISLNASNKTKIVMKKAADLDYRSSIIAKKDLDIYLEIIHEEENTIANISNHIINVEASKINLQVDDHVLSQETDSKQDNKIFDLAGGTNKIKPNLIVDKDEVEANHSAYIGKFKDEDLFYLRSRGISYEEANKLLINGFLMSNMNLSNTLKGEFNNFIINNL